MILARRIQQTFTKIILFNGTLAFSPNTINNTFLAYFLAKKWQQKNSSYQSWIQLIERVKELNDDLRVVLRKDPNQSDVQKFNNAKLFGDWNVEGDGAVFPRFKARAYFDSQLQKPLVELPPEERFDLSSEPGQHKAVMSDMDTDCQSKSKLFAFQLILNKKLSFHTQPSQFRNIGVRIFRIDPRIEMENDGYLPSGFQADWFLKGNIKLLSHEDESIEPNVLKKIWEKAQEGVLANQFLLRINQFNYNYQTKQSLINGYIESINNYSEVPSSHWRIISNNPRSRTPPFPPGPPAGPIFARDVKYGNGKNGVLLDLSRVYFGIVGNKYPQYRYLETKLKFNNLKQITISSKDAEAFCGLYLIQNTSLNTGPNSATVKVVLGPKVGIFEGVEQAVTFQIVERYKKTPLLNSNKNEERFVNHVDFEVQIRSFGNILANQEVTLGLSVDISTDQRGYQQYKDGKVELRLRKALKDPDFKLKYQSIQNIKEKVYQKEYDTIIQTTKILEDKIKPIYDKDKKFQGYRWRKNGTNELFQLKFYSEFKDGEAVKIHRTDSITLRSDDRGRVKFSLALDEDLNEKNNPRNLDPPPGSNNYHKYAIMSSLALDATITGKITLKAGEPPQVVQDGVSVTFFQSNNSADHNLKPDWVNLVGPRLRLMALLYPAMQKIVNLYDFKSIHLSGMKRAFDIESELHSRYMPSTREMSPFEHRAIRRWLYEPFYDMKFTNINFKRCYQRVYKKDINSTPNFAAKKAQLVLRLKQAFAFELYTIPLYLTAMYTTDRVEYADQFRTVVHDQMKHLFIVSNLLNAIRESDADVPPYLDPDYVPSYPSSPLYVYHTEDCFLKQIYRYDILPLSNAVLLKMIAAEFPSESQQLVFKNDPSLTDQQNKCIDEINNLLKKINTQQEKNQGFITIGELYAQITQRIWDLNDIEEKKKNVRLFSGAAENQFTYPQLEHMTEIYSLRTALNQIRLIVEEGEGAQLFDISQKIKKKSHFIKFIEIYVGAEIDEARTTSQPHNSELFEIYFKRANLKGTPQRKDPWTEPQNKQIRQLVVQEESGLKAYGFSNYTNVVAIDAFKNSYVKILQELHYVFNTDYKKFKQYLSKNVKSLEGAKLLSEAELLAEYKNFRFKRMENAVAKMRQMSLHSRYNVRPDPMPSSEIKAPLEKAQLFYKKSVKPDYEVKQDIQDYNKNFIDTNKTKGN